MIALAGPGESSYTLYDREICARAQVWLRERYALEKSNESGGDKPWVLFVPVRSSFSPDRTAGALLSVFQSEAADAANCTPGRADTSSLRRRLSQQLLL